jgi:type II secretory pathway component PulK
MTRPTQHHARGAVLLIVLWAIAIASVVTASIQLFSTRQATLGRDAVARTQARWAARGGVEQMLAVMETHTLLPYADDAWAMVKDMEEASSGQLHFASYDIRHHMDGRDWAGPLDEQGRLNINAADAMMLNLLRDITPDVIDAILDWRDTDEEPRSQGAEEAFYANLKFPYKPRNADFHSVAELELVAGIWPEHLRGEDWNLNGRLDANENDGDLSWPIDAADGILDAGWSAWLTARSVRGGMAASGQPRLYLADSTAEELLERLANAGLTEAQAQMLVAFGRNSTNNLGMLLTTPLDSIGPDGRPQQPQPQGGRRGRGSRQSAQPDQQGEEGAQVEPLSLDQLRIVFREVTMDDPSKQLYGKININTVPELFLRELFPNEQATVDDILYLRSTRATGIGSMVDLLDIRGISAQSLNLLTQQFDVYSNVYTISSVGRSEPSGVQVEMIVTVDRSTLPARIIEYREQ